MNTYTSVNKTKKFDSWAGHQIELAAERLKKHFQYSEYSFLEGWTYEFNQKGRVYKTVSITTNLKWKQKNAQFDLSCLHKIDASNNHINDFVRIYIQNPISLGFLETTIGELVQFGKKDTIFNFLARDFSFFNDLNDTFTDQVVEYKEIDVLSNGKLIAMDLVKDIFRSTAKY